MYIIHTISICVYKSFSTTTLDKDLRKNITNRRDGETGKHKLNEVGALKIKQKTDQSQTWKSKL